MVLLVLMAVFAPWISPHDPYEQDLTQRLKPPLSINPSGDRYWLGTDQLGRDVLSRLIHGSRVSLLVGMTVMPISALIGTSMGLISGYRGGRTDEVIMRLVEIQMAIPFTVLALAVLVVFGPSTLNLILVLGITGWVNYAKLIRGEVLSVRKREFVQAAEALGCNHLRIISRHILPNVSSVLIVWSTLLFPRVIMSEAGLSFLGLGIQPPAPSWGGMLSNGRDFVWTAWWLSVFSGLAISFTVLGSNLFGDWLRDFLDPRQQYIREG
jgi:peptide/nickel transport system permease protein